MPASTSLETQLSSCSVAALYQLATMLPIDCPAQDLFELNHHAHTAKPVPKAALVKTLADKLRTLERTTSPTQRTLYMIAMVGVSVWTVYETILASKAGYKYTSLSAVSLAMRLQLTQVKKDIKKTLHYPEPQVGFFVGVPVDAFKQDILKTILEFIVQYVIVKIFQALLLALEHAWSATFVRLWNCRTLWTLYTKRDELKKNIKTRQTLKDKEFKEMTTKLQSVGFASALLACVYLMNTAASRMLRKPDYTKYLQRMTTVGADNGDAGAGPSTKTKRLSKAYDGCLEPVDDNLHLVFAMQNDTKLTLPQLHYWLLNIPGQRRRVMVAHLFTPDGQLRTDVNEMAHEIARAHSLRMRLQDKAFRLGRRTGLTKKRASTTLQSLKRKHGVSSGSTPTKKKKQIK
jgi:hypothetical protein